MRIDKFYRGQQPSEYFDGIANTENIEAFETPGVANVSMGTDIAHTFDGNYTVMCAGGDGGYSNANLYIFNCGVGRDEVYEYDVSTGNLVTSFATHASSVKNCIGYDGEVYFSTVTTLYKLSITGGTPGTVTTVGTYQNGNNGNRAMLSHGLDLYISDGKDVASVDSAGTFTTSALDLPSNYDINDMVSFGDDLLLGGGKTNGTGFTLRYDTFSESFYSPDLTDEVVYYLINSTDSNIIFAGVGEYGDIYYYNGARLDKYKTLNKDNTLITNAYLQKAVMRGRTLVAYNNKDIVGLHKAIKDETYGLLHLHTATRNISSLVCTFDTLFYVAEDYNDAQKVSLYRFTDTADKADGTITSSVVNERVDAVRVAFKEIPAGSQIEIYLKKDDDTNFTLVDSTLDTIDTNTVKTTNAINNKRSLQVEVRLMPNGADTPIIEYIDII